MSLGRPNHRDEVVVKAGQLWTTTAQVAYLSRLTGDFDQLQIVRVL